MPHKIDARDESGRPIDAELLLANHKGDDPASSSRGSGGRGSREAEPRRAIPAAPALPPEREARQALGRLLRSLSDHLFTGRSLRRGLERWFVAEIKRRRKGKR